MFNFITAEGNFADFMRTRIAPLFATVAYGIDAARVLIFKIVSQITISYHDSPLSIGSAGTIKGGDRLPWVEEGGVDNHAPLEKIDWQVQVYGEAGNGLRVWCLLHGMPIREFAWSRLHQEAGFARNAHYLVRPDGHVAGAIPATGRTPSPTTSATGPTGASATDSSRRPIAYASHMESRALLDINV